MPMPQPPLWLLLLLVLTQASSHSQFLSSPLHTNNWAVIISASRYWFNYRHTANALSVYRTVKRLGLPDERILLLLSDDVACNPRNPYPAQVFNHPDHATNLYGTQVEVDYRGFDVTVETFLRLLMDRHPPGVPTSKRLLSNEGSNVLVYVTGHGGEGFLKFSDAEQISAEDLADAFEQMHQKRRYRELLFVSDTCEAATLHARFYSPNLLAIGSAKRGQNSYSLHSDNEVGVPTMDRFTYYLQRFMEGVNQTSLVSLQALFHSFDPVKLVSEPETRADLYGRPLSKVRVTEFFSEQIPLHLTPVTTVRADPLPGALPLPPDAMEETMPPDPLAVEDNPHHLPRSAPPAPVLTYPLHFWVCLLSFAVTFLTGIAVM